MHSFEYPCICQFTVRFSLLGERTDELKLGTSQGGVQLPSEVIHRETAEVSLMKIPLTIHSFSLP